MESTKAAGLLAFTGALAFVAFEQEAEAAACQAPFYCTHVTDSVVDNANGTWSYDFTVHNDTAVSTDSFYGSSFARIIDWELPYFPDANIQNVRSPEGWTWAIETIGTPNSATGWDGIARWQNAGDPFYQGPDSPYTTGTEVLHWYADAESGTFIDHESSLGGFGFDAAYGATNSPYQASWQLRPSISGDPAFPDGGAGIPNSPQVSGVPIPASFLLFGSAASLLLTRRRRPALA